MKFDFEAINEIEGLIVEAVKCRQMIADLTEMIDSTNDKYFALSKERLFLYASVIFDYVIKIDEGLKELCKAEIKEAPAPTKVQGATKTN